MARPRRTDPPIEWKISLPSSLAQAVTDRLTDPLYERIRFGARSTLIEYLLRQWLSATPAGLKKDLTTPDIHATLFQIEPTQPEPPQ